ncbi:hypothetical protein BDW74DRAFT_143378 [Aspergillus multicolor]|uniref:FAD-dependent oxidoreductase n=1 Tax=Aspergillus multicolor TaxID=41759 RepID=UPI003CCD59F3
MKERYGYCGLWIDRPTLLATLYDRIGDKSRLLAGKRVAAVAHFEDRVVVTTGDGEVYEGDILVGADGEHSRVREEMVRLAGEMGGGVNTDGDFDDEKEASATYACLFAHSTLPASHPSTPLPRGLLGWNLGKDYSYVLGTGPGNRVYWLLSKKMDKTCYGSEIPKITEEEKEKIVSEHWNDALTPILKMGELFESRNVLVCTPLREIVYKKTGLGRIGVLGDAGHKMLPIIAQGGNQAIESVAAFTNALVNVLSSKSKTNPGVSLSASEVESVFDTVREARAARVDKIVAMGQQRQKMDTMATPELEVLMREKFPGMMPGIILQRWDDTFPGSVELEGARMGNLNGDAFVDAEGVLGVASLEVTTQPQA